VRVHVHNARRHVKTADVDYLARPRGSIEAGAAILPAPDGDIECRRYYFLGIDDMTAQR
jgi:hypothetical protein